MTKPIHFVSISGGKDSTATACLAIERAERRDMSLRFMFADTGNEHEHTIEHVSYLARALNINIETVKADLAPKFAARRENMRKLWPVERREKQHTAECRTACADLAHAERALIRGECDCPVRISPPVPDHLIEEAVALMQPTGIPFLDMGMLSGRFPGAKSRFCTEILKLEPMEQVKDRVRMAGTPIVEWIGERAEESASRAAKPPIERVFCSWRAPSILYRPIHKLKAAETFTIARRHGLKPNPLYLLGMSRVGCMPCIMAKKGELREIARRFPEHIDRIERWEKIVGSVSRHSISEVAAGARGELISSFMPTDKVPADALGNDRASIRRAVAWANTGRGGKNFDLLNALDDIEFSDQPNRCSSAYGLCE